VRHLLTKRVSLVLVGLLCLGLLLSCPNPTAQSYTITYNANGATSGSVPIDSTNYTQGQIVTVLGNTGSLVKTGNAFVGWNTQADGNGTTYTQGQTLSMGSANVVLHAKWTSPLGSLGNPIVISSIPFADARDTSIAGLNEIGSYPPYPQNMSGNEFIYQFHTASSVLIAASVSCLLPVDVDIILLSSITPVTALTRNNSSIAYLLTPGTYYFVVDTLFDSVDDHSGSYLLEIQ
jgi:hypothetical protein